MYPTLSPITTAEKWTPFAFSPIPLQELLLDLLLHRYWREPRIRFTGQAQPGRQYPVDSLDRDKFWTPDLYVLGMREFRPMAGSMGLDHLVLRHDQSVEQLLRATLSMRCQFNFRLFPLDSQECKMDFMSRKSKATSFKQY
ncbi:Uncharacterized protein GBIM_04874 [Gryllus bimaculatus]|nr:Uncharacterized protein GBIM_04874 [Gryllus bimaculatus]